MPPSLIRSFLFVPGNAPHKMHKALGASADALILDLEDAVAPADKLDARKQVANFLARHNNTGPELWVRINPVSQSESLHDLAAIMYPTLAGIVVPKTDGPEDIARLSWQLDALEIHAGLTPGSIKLMPVATETATAVFRLGEYRHITPRLHGLTWGAEDLAASLHASTNRTENGELALPYQLARTLCLTGARAAGVLPVETALMDFRDPEVVFRYASNARRDGFFGMMAIHPAQVDPINRAFTPSADEQAAAAAIVSAFVAAGNPGVLAMDGRMLDLVHLRQAQNLLALTTKFATAP
jgi:citrate lyase subunit beta/citryl-CoA lyase